ncbi:MAG: hypothetical protein H6728_10750 [Myxococcales bacterium]|nr:hypothetical protein [Myxococcales bacterium]MCB9643538.1 hypothetical protein [Myxococcales bacterium]
MTGTNSVLLRCIATLVGLWLWVGGHHAWAGCPKEHPSGLQSYKWDGKRGTWEILRYKEPFPFLLQWPNYKGQTVAWKVKMEESGKHYLRHAVQRIYLVHGTFVGADGLGLFRLLGSASSYFASHYKDAQLRNVKHIHDKLFGDKGNFTKEYVKLLEAGLGGKIPVKRFLWSSENHHLARLLGAWRLILQMSKDLQDKPLKKGERILLLGHSHAGQVFAMLTHLRKPSAESAALWKALTTWWGKKWPQERARLEKALAQLKGGGLDFVTLGTPVRYRWTVREGDRLLHLINHRPLKKAKTPLEKTRGGSFRNIFYTTDGDYVQQLGIAGSDLLANTPTSLRLNNELALVFGVGVSPSCLQTLLKQRTRLHEQGHHLLVDYLDQSSSMFSLNGNETMFGHGIYTRRKVMSFTMRLIARYLYR